MRTVEIKTIWAGRAWVHQKYLNEAKNKGEGLELVHIPKRGDVEVMSIPAEKIDKQFWEKSKDAHRDKFSGEKYYLWGIVWKPVDNSKLQSKLF